MRQPPLNDRFGALLTFVKPAFLFLSPEDALNSRQTAMKPPMAGVDGVRHKRTVAQIPLRKEGRSSKRKYRQKVEK
jgi:hypothetical protein